MKVYCVRQKSTGLFIPRLETGKRRGGSHLEPSNEREPRIFHNKIAARAFLSQWLQGIFKETIHHDFETGYPDPELKVIPQPHRKKDDMEIVEFTCIENIWNPISTLPRNREILIRRPNTLNPKEWVTTTAHFSDSANLPDFERWGITQWSEIPQ